MAHLLRNTGIPPHLVQATIEREDAMDWGNLPANLYTEGERYYLYEFDTGEINGILVC